MCYVPQLIRVFLLWFVFATAVPSAIGLGIGGPPAELKLDRVLQSRAHQLTGRTRVIVRGADGALPGALSRVIRAAGGVPARSLPLIGASVADVPNVALAALARNPFIARISQDRVIVGAMERTSGTIGATAVRRDLGYDGSGIGVAIIDSGADASHDDLMAGNGAPRIDRFVDFVNGRDVSYDDYGHGTHVAGIVAGNGFDSSGARSGIAPGARLTVLKVLDHQGTGHVSDVIAALDYVVANRDALNIRVVNLSVASPVYESYDTDPLTVAAERVVDAGVVVIAAAGNNGRDPEGRTRYGGVTAPGNAPWVLTVGASSHMGTLDRADDTIAPFSSRGPTAVDYGAKPDLVAPGVGIESLSSPSSAFYTTRSAYLLAGSIPTPYLPYLSLSGTSMAAPVVAGTVALMLQANPSLTPNAVKAILQYTAEDRAGYDPLTQGAGSLNAFGAVALARYLGGGSTGAYPDPSGWSRRILWGNQLVRGGQMRGDANAWGTDVRWGARLTRAGQLVAWGVRCADRSCTSTSGPWRWGNALAINVVWGPTCDGDDCTTAWSGGVWDTSDDGDTVVWGTADDGDTVVWGTADDGDTVVWGTSCTDSTCEPIVWKRQ